MEEVEVVKSASATYHRQGDHVAHVDVTWFALKPGTETGMTGLVSRRKTGSNQSKKQACQALFLASTKNDLLV